mgnify:CR=1 FL=1
MWRGPGQEEEERRGRVEKEERRLEEVSKDYIIWGQSLGAAVGLQALSIDDRIKVGIISYFNKTSITEKVEILKWVSRES